MYQATQQDSDHVSPYVIPEETCRWQALALAVLVHAVLLSCLWLGAQQQRNDPVAGNLESGSTRQPALSFAQKEIPGQQQVDASVPAKSMVKPAATHKNAARIAELKRKERQMYAGKKNREKAARQRALAAMQEKHARKEDAPASGKKTAVTREK